MAKKEEPKRGRPRAGDGTGHSKPTTGNLIWMGKEGRVRRNQPKGWAISNVTDLFKGKKHRKPKGQ